MPQVAFCPCGERLYWSDFSCDRLGRMRYACRHCGSPPAPADVPDGRTSMPHKRRGPDPRDTIAARDIRLERGFKA